MMKHLKKLEDEVSAWPSISIHPHHFGGMEFRFESAELGHVHTGGIVDISFPRPVRDALLAEGLAEEHQWVPNSGWITFHVRKEEDLKHALWLMRLSYLRYALKTAADPRGLFEKETEELHRSSDLCSKSSCLKPQNTFRLSRSRRRHQRKGSMTPTWFPCTEGLANAGRDGGRLPQHDPRLEAPKNPTGLR